MPINSTDNREVYSGNGVTTVFPYGYYFLADSDLVVIKTEVASGAAVVLALNSDYTVTGAADPNGGSVTISPAPASGFKITIYRDPPITQTQDYRDLDSLPEEELERPLDKLTMICQRLKELITRSLRLGDGDVAVVDTTLPTFEPDKYFRVNSAGDAIELVTLVVPTGAVTTASETSEGIAEIATQAEVDAGTDPLRFITPEKLANSQLAADVADLGTYTDALREAVSFKNVLINGGFRVNQRRVTTGAADNTYCLDRWLVMTQTSTITIAQQNRQEDGTSYNIRLTQAQASAQRMGIVQPVESANCLHLRGRNATFAGRVRCSSSQAIRFAVCEWVGAGLDGFNSTQRDIVNDWTSASYTAGGFFKSTNMTVSGVGSITPAANTWTDFTLSVPISSSMSNVFVMVWTEGTAAQNVTLDVGRCQLVQGSEAPAFIEGPYMDELHLCQAYYQHSFSGGITPAQSQLSGRISFAQTVAASTANNGGVWISFTRAMRLQPTVTLYNPVNANGQVHNITTGTDCTLSGTRANDNGVKINFTAPSGSAAGNELTVQYSADAELP